MVAVAASNPSEHQRVVIVSEGAIGAEALVQEAPLLPSSFQAADGRHTLHTARRERKQLFPLLFPRDEAPADGGGKKLPLCSAGLLTSNSREARNYAFLFVFIHIQASLGVFFRVSVLIYNSLTYWLTS